MKKLKVKIKNGEVSIDGVKVSMVKPSKPADPKYGDVYTLNREGNNITFNQGTVTVTPTGVFYPFYEFYNGYGWVELSGEDTDVKVKT